MSAEFVRGKQSGTATTLSITSATKGNLLVAFININGAGSKVPVCEDNLGSGWHTNTEPAIFVTYSLWMSTKIASGGENLIKPKIEGEGEIAGIGYFELSNAGIEDIYSIKSNTSNARKLTSSSFSTSEANDIVLAAVGIGGLSGEINAWTETGPLTNIETATARVICGYYVPGVKLTSAKVTANWSTVHTCAMIVVAFKEEAAGKLLAMIV